MKRLALIAASVLLASCGALTEMAGLRDDLSPTERWPDVGQNAGEPRNNNLGAQVNLRPPHDLNSVPKPKTKPRKVERIKPKTLVGMTREQVKTLIGDPATVADRPPATV